MTQLFTGELTKHAVLRGNEARDKWDLHGCVDIDDVERFSTVSVGLLFPVRHVHALAGSIISVPLETSGAVYLASVLEYIAAEVLEVSGKAAGDREGESNPNPQITRVDIGTGVENDAELHSMLAEFLSTPASGDPAAALHPDGINVTAGTVATTSAVADSPQAPSAASAIEHANVLSDPSSTPDVPSRPTTHGLASATAPGNDAASGVNRHGPLAPSDTMLPPTDYGPGHRNNCEQLAAVERGGQRTRLPLHAQVDELRAQVEELRTLLRAQVTATAATVTKVEGVQQVVTVDRSALRDNSSQLLETKLQVCELQEGAKGCKNDLGRMEMQALLFHRYNWCRG